MQPNANERCSECLERAAYYRLASNKSLIYACTTHCVGHVGEWQAVDGITHGPHKAADAIREGLGLKRK